MKYLKRTKINRAVGELKGLTVLKNWNKTAQLSQLEGRDCQPCFFALCYWIGIWYVRFQESVTVDRGCSNKNLRHFSKFQALYGYRFVRFNRWFLKSFGGNTDLWSRWNESTWLDKGNWHYNQSQPQSVTIWIQNWTEMRLRARNAGPLRLQWTRRLKAVVKVFISLSRSFICVPAHQHVGCEWTGVWSSEWSAESSCHRKKYCFWHPSESLWAEGATECFVALWERICLGNRSLRATRSEPSWRNGIFTSYGVIIML